MIHRDYSEIKSIVINCKSTFYDRNIVFAQVSKR